VTDVDPFANRPQQTFQPGRYGGATIPGSSNGVWANKVLVRADVQFLRQDFSVTFPVSHTYSSVQGLRFDFLIRTRPLKGTELLDWKKHAKATSTSCPQRDAVLAALRAVTGQDAGPTTDAWVKLYPHASAEAEGARIAAALRKAAPEHRDQLLAGFRDAKPEHYTEGLANAIPHFKGAYQTKVRAALVERMSRLAADALCARMQDDDDEVRRAAALACVRKADPDMLPDLIALLLDADAEVCAGAHKALTRMSGEDFGPATDAGAEERATAVAKWLAWQRDKGQ
jgi:hypothetical protein